MRNSRLLIGLLTCFCLCAAALALPARTALTATCYGSSCDGQDPFTTGCADDAYVVSSAPVRNDNNLILGNVSFYWSDTCQAGYTHVDAVDTASVITAGTYDGSRNSVVSAHYTLDVTSGLLSGSSSAEFSSCGNLHLDGWSLATGSGEGCAQ